MVIALTALCLCNYNLSVLSEGPNILQTSSGSLLSDLYVGTPWLLGCMPSVTNNETQMDGSNIAYFTSVANFPSLTKPRPSEITLR